MKKVNLSKHLNTAGTKVRKVWEKLSKKHNVPVTIGGVTPLLIFKFEKENAQAIKTLFVQEMLQRGILATNLFYSSYAHTPAHIAQYERAMDEVFPILKEAIDTNTVEKRLKGPIAHTGFQRLN